MNDHFMMCTAEEKKHPQDSDVKKNTVSLLHSRAVSGYRRFLLHCVFSSDAKKRKLLLFLKVTGTLYHWASPTSCIHPPMVTYFKMTAWIIKQAATVFI